MIRPTPRLAKAMVALLPFAVAIAFVPAVWPLWAAALLGLCVLAVVDWGMTLPRAQMEVSLTVPKLAYFGEPLQAAVSIPALPSRTSLELNLELQGAAETHSVRHVVTGADREWQIPIMAERRGKIDVLGLWLGWTGPLGLVQSIAFEEQPQECAVVPNVSAVQRAALRLSTHHTFLTGVKTRRNMGDGSEFESLRSYLPGLDHRMIDWKASAKHRKLLWREHRTERNHRIVLAFDTGRLMSEPLNGMPRLDHAINTGMLLAYLALRTGDQVGLLTFDSEIRTYVPPSTGVKTLPTLMHAAAGTEYTWRESNFTLAISELGRRLTRRSVVVIMTDFVDPISAELMVENLDHLSRRHLVIFVSLRDPALTEIVRFEPTSVNDVNRSVVANDLLQDREQVLSTLRRKGIHCIDTAPQDVSIQLLNKYLDIQRRELV
jgi:uncharacterized protein (DUF58 family)